MKVTGNMEGETKSKSCSRKLFFSKNFSSKVKQNHPTEVINSVTCLLGKVAIDLNDTREGPTENPIIEAAISHGPLKPDGTEASVQKNKVQVGEKTNSHAGLDETYTHCEAPDPTNLVDPSNSVHPQQGSATKRRVQKWKKLARKPSCSGDYDFTPPPVGEKRNTETSYVDAQMFDDELRGDFKRRNIPMEVDHEQAAISENVAGPTTWALQFK